MSYEEYLLNQYLLFHLLAESIEVDGILIVATESVDLIHLPWSLDEIRNQGQ